MAAISLTSSVGIKGINKHQDILTIQKTINKSLSLITPTKKLVEDGKLGSRPEISKTVAAIKEFQKKVVGMVIPDGLISVNGRTHRKINSMKVGGTAANTAESSNSTNAPGITSFPGTSFMIGKPKTTVAECLATLPAEMRSGFKAKISHIIKEMHKLGIAMGTPKRLKAGYRTFQVQHDLPSRATKAGPGESFHNYGLAADLGVLEWVDSKGKSYSDFWLASMDSKVEYKGLSAKIWAKRNSLAQSGVHSLSWEIIHLQGVPAKTSGRASLAKCLNKVAEGTAYSYQKGPGKSKSYQCKVSKAASWVDIGTAKELWDGDVKNVSATDKKIIASHMKAAENIAKTLSLST